jgi:hypothetical protein
MLIESLKPHIANSNVTLRVNDASQAEDKRVAL